MNANQRDTGEGMAAGAIASQFASAAATPAAVDGCGCGMRRLDGRALTVADLIQTAT